ncbi:MAG TPA: UDP-N-acetylglucosamine--N-acetylmuramyl-(pentapeptide) pyrophosphoryl-undecaprenol N-acetylglucosamine transferase [Thermohalobaculum sp.]|nr:UDP-N-acetylglucosamine--N-acetylmuramyl-(pentapeptide) pyrophosphoryl-undecaprenol N-acetylglucosamine transferase [Thermohalobaculum sp.]
MSGPLLVIAAGGTGGHMVPAQALAEEMLRRGWRVQLATDARGLRYADGFPQAVERVELSSASLQRGGWGARAAAPLALMNGALAAAGRFARDRPACVAGFGGYPAFPALAGALWRRIPRLIHEQNGVLGRVNRLFAGRVDRVVCGTWPVTNAPTGANLVRMGNPVRAAALEVRDRPYAPPGDGPLGLLVFGGSQGASVFARLVPAAVAGLPPALRERLHVTQQVREGEEDAVGAAYAEAGVEAALAPFFADMPRRIADAQLVIARAGASTVAELAAIGRPAILVPYPHAMDDHQTANARALSDAGGAVVTPEHGLTAGGLAKLIERILADPAEAAAMAEKARAAGNPTAASDLADLVEELGAGVKSG